MGYSFKKLLRIDSVTHNLFICFITFSIFFIILSVFPIITIAYEGIDYDLIKKMAGLYIFYSAYFLVVAAALVLLLIRSHNVKHFQENCSVITAKVESYYSLRSRNSAIVGYKIKFSYKFNNENYVKEYSIRKNKYTKTYLDNYLNTEETIRILVRNDNPQKILIKEIFD